MASNSLFPPIMPTYANAFIYTSNCEITFQVSTYMNIDDIKEFQISVVNQANNQSVLSSDLYPSGIMFQEISINKSTRTGKIVIRSTDLKNGFEYDTYYKVQIRCSSVKNTGTTAAATNKWLNANLNNFSEWSTVCLIQGISQPYLTLNGFEENENTILNESLPEIIGSLSFDKDDETETLRSYQIQILKDEEIYEDSGVIKATLDNGKNAFNYTVKKELTNNESDNYTLVVTITTKNYYEQVYEYTFSLSANTEDTLPCSIEVTPLESLGCNKIVLTFTEEYNGNFSIRRSEESVEKWEDLYTGYLNVKEVPYSYTYYDYSAVAGVFYYYGVQPRTPIGLRGTLKKIEKPIILTLDDIFLIDKNNSVKIKYDGTISSFKYVVSDQITATLGSKYPFARRAAETYYRSFSLSGLVSYQDDDENAFNKDLLSELHNTYINDYKGLLTENYCDENINKEINTKTDSYASYNAIDREHLLERAYRERIMKFLYDDTVKLYKSQQEGNILVKISNVSFTPNASVGRLVWNFSCQLDEVADFTLDNLNTYKIQTYGELHKGDSSTQTKIGQLNLTIKDKYKLSDLINQYLIKGNTTQEGYYDIFESLSYLKINFLSSPTYNSTYKIYGYPITVINSDGTTSDILVNTNGIYEISGDNTDILDVYFTTDQIVSLDFIYSIASVVDESSIVKSSITTRVLGQINHLFEYEESLLDLIKEKYARTLYDSDGDISFLQYLKAFEGIRVSANRGTVIEITEIGGEAQEFVIGDTEYLEIYKEKTNLFTDVKIKGIQLQKATDYEKTLYILPNHLYVDASGTTLPADENDRKNNYVYIDGDSIVIWHNYTLKPFDLSTGRIKCSTYALIDYLCQIRKQVY